LSSKFCTRESLTKTLKSKRIVIEMYAYSLHSKDYKELFRAKQTTIKI
jgi:hypothetical protein